MSYILLLGILLFFMQCNNSIITKKEETLSSVMIEQVKIHEKNMRMDKLCRTNILLGAITENDPSFDTTFVYLQLINTKEFYEQGILKYFNVNLYELSDSLGLLILNSKNPVFESPQKQPLDVSKYLIKEANLPHSSISHYFPIRVSFIENELVKMDTTINGNSPFGTIYSKMIQEKIPMPVVRHPR